MNDPRENEPREDTKTGAPFYTPFWWERLIDQPEPLSVAMCRLADAIANQPAALAALIVNRPPAMTEALIAAGSYSPVTSALVAAAGRSILCCPPIPPSIATGVMASAAEAIAAAMIQPP